MRKSRKSQKKSWESHEKALRKCSESHEKSMKKLWESNKNVWESHEIVSQASSSLFQRIPVYSSQRCRKLGTKEPGS